MSQLPTDVSKPRYALLHLARFPLCLALRRLNGRPIGWRKETNIKNLDYMTIRCVELATYARNAFKANQHELANEELGRLYDLLDDHVGSGARDKGKSAESDPER